VYADRPHSGAMRSSRSCFVGLRRELGAGAVIPNASEVRVRYLYVCMRDAGEVKPNAEARSGSACKCGVLSDFGDCAITHTTAG